MAEITGYRTPVKAREHQSQVSKIKQITKAKADRRGEGANIPTDMLPGDRFGNQIYPRAKWGPGGID
jgi:hypothetical protein